MLLCFSGLATRDTAALPQRYCCVVGEGTGSRCDMAGLDRRPGLVALPDGTQRGGETQRQALDSLLRCRAMIANRSNREVGETPSGKQQRARKEKRP